MSFQKADLTFGALSFAPGFMDSPEEDTLPAGASPDAKNGVLLRVQMGAEVRAVLAKREGHRLLNPTAIVSEKAIDGATWFRRTGFDDELVVACNGALYTYDVATTAFVALTGGSGFTPENVVTFLQFKDNLFAMDGVQMLRYNGTACFPVGFIEPTGAPGLAVAAGPGVTGTFESYAVWYDSAMDHESSPSAASAPVAFANEKRHHTKPAGAPPANVNFWRVYVRRTDTNENQFYRAGTVAIATGTLDEVLIDAARTDAGAGPLTDTNDVPPMFAVAEEWKGYRLGVPLNSADVYVSRVLDPESQHPKDVFPIGGKADAKALRSVRKFGARLLLRKPTRTYQLVGDTVPFIVDPVNSEWGGVSQKSGVEVGSYWYDWDERRGPYRTDLSDWTALGTSTINDTLKTVNHAAVSLIECAYYATLDLIVWAIPTGFSPRKRTLLAYQNSLQAWLPPITGFEWSGLTEYTTPDGVYGLYAGDCWGRVYQVFSGVVDGVPGGTFEATLTAGTVTLVTAAAAVFYTTGSGLAGMPAVVVSPSGNEQWVTIKSNTATALTINSNLNPVPAAGWTVIVGGINWYWTTPRYTGGDPFISKSKGWVYVQAGMVISTHRLRVDVRLNRSGSADQIIYFTFTAAGLVWGAGVWGDEWGAGGTRDTRKHRIRRAYKDVSFRFSNYYPQQPVELVSFKVTADWLRRRQVKSVA